MKVKPSHGAADFSRGRHNRQKRGESRRQRGRVRFEVCAEASEHRPGGAGDVDGVDGGVLARGTQDGVGDGRVRILLRAADKPRKYRPAARAVDVDEAAPRGVDGRAHVYDLATRAWALPLILTEGRFSSQKAKQRLEELIKRMRSEAPEDRPSLFFSGVRSPWCCRVYEATLARGAYKTPSTRPFA